MPKKTIVAGGRHFKGTLKHRIWLLQKLFETNTNEVVCGMANGADQFGKKIGTYAHMIIKEFHAEWKKYGKVAGPIRNAEMAKYADICILFPGGKGTENMKKLAKLNNLEIIEYVE